MANNIDKDLQDAKCFIADKIAVLEEDLLDETDKWARASIKRALEEYKRVERCLYELSEYRKEYEIKG